jgi:hypothetical protein
MCFNKKAFKSKSYIRKGVLIFFSLTDLSAEISFLSALFIDSSNLYLIDI